MSRERQVKLLESQNKGDKWENSYIGVRKIYIVCPRGRFQLTVKSTETKETIYSEAISGPYQRGPKGGKGGAYEWGDVVVEVVATQDDSEIQITVEWE